MTTAARPHTPAGLVFIVSAPSGAGKTSLVNALLHRVDGLRLSVSHTTRAPREGEIDGRHYHFVDRATFEAEIASGSMLEYAEVFGNLYGTSARFVAERVREGDDVVLEIDWQGAALARERLADQVSVMVLPPTLTALEHRLRNRGKDSDAVIGQRLATAREEMRHAADFDYVIVNDDFDAATDELVAVVRAERARSSRRLAHNAPLLARLLGRAVDMPDDPPAA